MSMSARGIARSAAVLLGAAALWAVPISGAQARGYHPNPPRQPAQSQQASSGSTSTNNGGAAPEGCFRRYDERCQRAREERRARQGSGGGG
jgi:hypothetical protein